MQGLQVSLWAAAVSLEKRPNGHSKHDVEAEVLEYRPPSHDAHVELDLASIALEKRPEEHL